MAILKRHFLSISQSKLNCEIVFILDKISILGLEMCPNVLFVRVKIWVQHQRKFIRFLTNSSDIFGDPLCLNFSLLQVDDSVTQYLVSAIELQQDSSANVDLKICW